MFNKYLNFKTVKGVHDVTYLIYDDKTKYRWNSINYPKVTYKDNTVTKGKNTEGYIINIRQACFAGLVGKLEKDKKYLNRIIYFFKWRETLSHKQKRDWLLLNKKHGCLPKSLSVDKVLKKRAVVFDVTKQNYNMLYVYLSSIRFIPAEPTYVKNMLILTKKFKLDFYIASVFATHINMSNINHHFLPEGPSYMKPSNVDMITDMNLKSMVGFYRFIENNGIKKSKDTNFHGFNVNNTIKNYCKIDKNISALVLLNKGFSKIIKLSTDKEIEKNLTKIFKK